MLDHAQLQALLAIERERGFVRAADKLGMSRAAISQRIRTLEDRVGLVLVHRNRPVRMTDSGRLLCRHAETIELMEKDVLKRCSVDAAVHPSKAATLRVIVDQDSLATWFGDALAKEIKARDPRLFEVLVMSHDRSLMALKDGRALVAISSHSEPIQGFISRPLGTETYRAVASPTFMERYLSEGTTFEALQQAPCLCREPNEELHRQWLDLAYGTAVRRPSHVVPSAHLAVEACLRNLGWTVAASSLVKPHLERGELVELAPETVLEVALYWHVSAMAENPLRSFGRSVMRAAQDHFGQRPPSAPPVGDG